MNSYAYCGNNPLSYVDPDGEWFFEKFTFAGALYGALYGGVQSMLNGGTFGAGAYQGALDGIKIFGSIGILVDLALAANGDFIAIGTYNGKNPEFLAALSLYRNAFNGYLGFDSSVAFSMPDSIDLGRSL